MREKIEIVLDNDVWKELKIDGYEHYWISREGQVYNSKAKRMMKPGTSNVGYTQICLHSPKAEKKQIVHQVGRLVALAHIPNPNPELYKEVNHKDNDRTNNRVENLEWCSRSMNCSTPEWREKHSKIMREHYADPEWRKMISERRAEGVRKFHSGGNTDEWHENRSKCHTEVMTKYWGDVKSGKRERAKTYKNNDGEQK